MSGFMRKAALVVGAVALVAATAGAAAPLLAPGMAGAAGIAGVSAATLTAIGTYGGLAAGVLTAISTATAPGMSSQGSQTSFTTNPQSGLPYAMGRTRMSGLRIYANTNTRPGYTKFNDLLWFGALLSIGGAIGGIEKFTADNEIVSFDASGNAIGDYHDYQAQKIHLGDQQTSALALTLGGGSAPGWSSAHKLSGITHAMWCLRYNKQGEMYGAGAPEPAWIGNWVKVYDPRLDSTYPGGSGSCRALVESTYVWSDNPGLHALTWALGRWQNGKRTCGIGAPVANIRVAEFVECANVCEANGWKVGGVEWTTDSKWDTLKRILQAGGAIPTQTGAMVGCLVSTPRTAIATIESRHLLDSLSIAATKSRRDRFNSVIPRYVDEASDWSVISGTAITVSDYVTADKGQRTKEIDYPLVQVFSGDEATQPGQLAAYDIVNSREAGPINFTTGPEWIGLKTGDVILLNVPEEGLVNQPVLITRRAPDPSTGKVSFSAQTETYAKHAYALGQSTTPPAPFSLSAPDLKPPAPAAANWAAAGTVTGEGLPAIVVTGNSEMPSADAVLIDYKLPADATWTRSAILSANEPVQHVIAPLQSETAYQVRVGYRVEQIDGDFTILAAVTTGTGIISSISDSVGEQRDKLNQLEQDTIAAQAAITAAQQQIATIEASVIADLSAINSAVASLNSEVDTVQGNISALQSASSAVQQSVSALQGSVSTAQGNISDLQTQAAGIIGSIGDINTEVDQISQTVSTQDGYITTLQQSVTGLNGTVSTLSSTVATQGSSISQNAQAITTLSGSVASLTTQVSAGGGNLLQNTDIIDLSYWVAGNYGAGTPLRVGAGGSWVLTDENALHIAQPNGDSSGYSEWFQWLTVEAGKWYDASALAAAHRCLIEIYLQWFDLAGNALYAPSTGAVTAGPGTADIKNWSHLGFKAQAPVNATRAQLILRKFGTTSGADSYAWFCRPQVKETLSGAATPQAYSVGSARGVVSVQMQALSNMTTSFASLETRVSSAEGSVSTLQSSLTSANGSISTLQTNVSSLNGSVATLQQSSSTQAGQISTLLSTVSSQGATISSNSTAISTLNGSVASLSNIVTASSNPNICPNGGFENGLRGWTGGGQNPTGWNVYTFVWGYYVGNGGYAGSTGNYTYLDSARFPIAGDGNSYTQSFDVDFQGSAGSFAYGEMVWLRADNSVIGSTGTPQIPPRSFDVTGNSRMRWTHTAPPQAVTAWARVVFYAPNGGNIVGVNFRQMKVEFGSVATPYSGEATAGQMYQAYADLNSSFASLSTTVSSQGGSISTLQSSYTSLNGTVSTLSSTVSAQGTSITNLQTASATQAGQIATLTTQLTAGGGNLLTNTDFAYSSAQWGFNASGLVASGNWIGARSSWVTSDENAIQIAQDNGTSSGYADFTQQLTATAGEWYDVSALVAAHGCAVEVIIQWLNDQGQAIGAESNGPTAIEPATGGANLLGWYKYNFKRQAPTGTVRATFYFRKYATAWGMSSSYAWMMRPQVAVTLQGSASPLAYSPGSARASIIQQASAISTLNSQYASLSSTVSTQGSSISQNATAISTLQGQQASLSSTVSTQGASISALQTATSTMSGDVATLTTRVTAGAPNLLRYGGFPSGLTGWSVFGPNWTASGADDPNWGRFVTVNATQNSYAGTAIQAVQPGQQYTISADIDRGGSSGGLVAARIVWTKNGNTLVVGPVAAAPNGWGFSNDESARRWATGTAPSDADGFYAQLVVEGVTGQQYFRRIKVNTGSYPARYSDEAAIVQSFETLSTLTTQYASLSSTVATQGVSISTQATAITTIQGNVTTLFGRLYFGVDVGGRLSSMTVNNNGIASSIIFNSDLVRFESPDPGTGALEWKDEAIQMRDGAGKLRIFMGYRA